MNSRAMLVAAAFFIGAILSPAEAHWLSAPGAGFAPGFAHPFSGLDHLLAMVAVGVWAAQLGGRAVLLLPVAFPAMMAVGALVSGAGVSFPSVELGIAASVVALGLLITFGVRIPLAAGSALVGLFAVLHGHAHGAELPQAASPVIYGAAFLGATVILHAIGVALGFALRQPGGKSLIRLTGAGVAATGVVIAATLF